MLHRRCDHQLPTHSKTAIKGSALFHAAMPGIKHSNRATVLTSLGAAISHLPLDAITEQQPKKGTLIYCQRIEESSRSVKEVSKELLLGVDSEASIVVTCCIHL